MYQAYEAGELPVLYPAVKLGGAGVQGRKGEEKISPRPKLVPAQKVRRTELCGHMMWGMEKRDV